MQLLYGRPYFRLIVRLLLLRKVGKFCILSFPFMEKLCTWRHRKQHKKYMNPIFTLRYPRSPTTQALLAYCP